MQHLDEGMIHAWLDGELSPSEREAFEAHVAACARCAAAVAEARGFVAASSRILTALDTVPGSVVPATPLPSPRMEQPKARFTASRAWMAVAAVLVLSTVTVIAIRPGGDAAQLQVATAARDQKEVPTAAAPAEEKAMPMKPNAAPFALDSHAVGGTAQAAPDSLAAGSAGQPAGGASSGGASYRSAPATVQSRAVAPADEPKVIDQTERLKSRLEAERKLTRVRESSGAPAAMADAAPPSQSAAPQASTNLVSKSPATPPTAMASAKDAAEKRQATVSEYDSASGLRGDASARNFTITGRVTSDAGAPLASASVAVAGTRIATVTDRDGNYELLVPAARASGQTISLVAREIGYKAAAVPISLGSAQITNDFVLVSNPLALSEVVVTGEGTTTSAQKLRGSLASNEAPQLVSRSSSTDAGDTVVTTIYAVRDGTVTLIDRSSARDEPRRQKTSSDFSDQVMKKARDDSRIDSITWSDSTGHTRTLRGAVSREELERIRIALFGAKR